MSEYLMLEKEIGHPVSPKDNKTSLNPNPKETDGVRSEYITLFSLPASPYHPAKGLLRGHEDLLGGGAEQVVILGGLAAWLGEAAKRSRREAKDEFFEFLIYFFTVADGDDDYKELFFFDPVYDSIVGCPQRTQAGQIIGQRLSFGGINR
jgi:hypothetical protein